MGEKVKLFIDESGMVCRDGLPGNIELDECEIIEQIEASTEDLHSLLRYDSEELRRADSEKMKRFTTTLNAVSGEAIPFERVRSALRAGFEKYFSGSWVAAGLTSAEKKLRDDILESSASPVIF